MPAPWQGLEMTSGLDLTWRYRPDSMIERREAGRRWCPGRSRSNLRARLATLGEPSILLFNPEQGSWRSIGSIRQSKKADARRWKADSIEWKEGKGEVDVQYGDGGPGLEKFYYSNTAPSRDESRAAAPGQVVPSLEVFVRQSLNQPPVLFASSGIRELALWNPNPQLAKLDMGTAEAYEWTDQDGRAIKGVLFKPSDWTPGRRYPLVIEARSYHQDRFFVDGTYPTAVAARAMVEDGMLVLQAGEPAMREKDMFVGATARALEGYEAAIRKLSAAGMIDPARVGIIGFSRTCDNVLYAIAKRPNLFAAATSANGLTYGPMQYLSAVDESLDPRLLEQFERHYGGKPLGSGLQQWVSENAVFQAAHVQTPLRVETHDPEFGAQILTDWEPFAALRSLDKPVDLIVLPYATHVVSMPSDLEESQQGDVDWFRFWLQGYEDPDNTKAEQYRRWERLCHVEKALRPGEPSSCVETKK